MSNLANLKSEAKKQLVEQAIEYLEYNPDCFGADLHNGIYNSDYFIIGRAQAEEWLDENFGTWRALDVIKEYETDNFGQVQTDISEPEKVTNMLVYILGEEILAESEHLTSECWNNCLTEEDCKQIIAELKELI